MPAILFCAHFTGPVQVVFEVIPAAYEAECEREAFVHALEHKKSYKGTVTST